MRIGDLQPPPPRCLRFSPAPRATVRGPARGVASSNQDGNELDVELTAAPIRFW